LLKFIISNKSFFAQKAYFQLTYAELNKECRKNENEGYFSN